MYDMRPRDINRLMFKRASKALKQIIVDKGVECIDEETVRACLFNALSELRDYFPKKECENRTDLVVYKKKNNLLYLLYELKTYFKAAEYICYDESNILKDLYKLATRRSESSAYFILVCSKEQLRLSKEKDCRKDELQFIYEECNQGTIHTIIYADVSISIVTKRIYSNDLFYIYTWEVKKASNEKKSC